MSSFISLFQTASGSWHWPSVLTTAGWLVGFVVTGFFLFAGLYVNRFERVKSAAEMEKSKGALEQLQEAQQPWQFSAQQRDRFIAALTDAVKGKVAVEYIRSDERRAYPFAMEMKRILDASGYDVWGHVPGFEQAGSAPLVGVGIIIKDKQSDIVGGFLQRAFKQAGIEAVGMRRTNNNYEDDRAIIWIGIRPSPIFAVDDVVQR